MLDFDGKLITHWAEEIDDPDPVGGPHDIWIDDQGAIYVADVGSDGVLRKYVPAH